MLHQFVPVLLAASFELTAEMAVLAGRTDACDAEHSDWNMPQVVKKGSGELQLLHPRYIQMQRALQLMMGASRALRAWEILHAAHLRRWSWETVG